MIAITTVHCSNSASCSFCARKWWQMFRSSLIRELNKLFMFLQPGMGLRSAFSSPRPLILEAKARQVSWGQSSRTPSLLATSWVVTVDVVKQQICCAVFCDRPVQLVRSSACLPAFSSRSYRTGIFSPAHSWPSVDSRVFYLFCLPSVYYRWSTIMPTS